MAGEEAANRYAQAVFAIALQQGTVDQWRSDLNDIATVLVDSGMAAVFADDRVPLSRRYEIVDSVLNIPPLARNLAKLLIQKGRTGAARGVAEAFEAIADAHAGIAKAQITTAVPIDDPQRQAIEGQLSERLGKTVTATTAVDPSLVGGTIIRVGDQLIDGSVATRLRLLRRELTA
jgi:F-type H+-transporting ATPase subunit delta